MLISFSATDRIRNRHGHSLIQFLFEVAEFTWRKQCTHSRNALVSDWIEQLVAVPLIHRQPRLVTLFTVYTYSWTQACCKIIRSRHRSSPPPPYTICNALSLLRTSGRCITFDSHFFLNSAWLCNRHRRKTTENNRNKKSVYPIPQIALDFRCKRKTATPSESTALNRLTSGHWIRICRAIPSAVSLAILSIHQLQIRANVSFWISNLYNKKKDWSANFRLISSFVLALVLLWFCLLIKSPLKLERQEKKVEIKNSFSFHF